MTAPLKERMTRHITMNGPLPLAEFMHWALADKTHGYYQTQNAFGREGDFITAPEVSQMFGELIGIWAIKAWHSLGKPNPFNLVELGPGNGTLMSDLLRATKIDPDFATAANVAMIETSDRLITEQQKALKGYEHVRWHKSLDDIADLPIVLIGNELLDALPPRQYVKHDEDWFERGIGVDESKALVWVAIPTNKLEKSALPNGHEEEPNGSILEISTIRESFVQRVAERIAKNSGAALFIDYGHVQSSYGDTFQAMMQHEYTDPLLSPGEADLTSHVDFEPLIKMARQSGCSIMPIMTQGEFLLALGLLERAGHLGAGKSQAEQTRITREAERLALPHEMGDLFKVFAFCSCDRLWPFTEIANENAPGI